MAVVLPTTNDGELQARIVETDSLRSKENGRQANVENAWLSEKKWRWGKEIGEKLEGSKRSVY